VAFFVVDEPAREPASSVKRHRDLIITLAAAETIFQSVVSNKDVYPSSLP
jgi:hypothetical protein